MEFYSSNFSFSLPPCYCFYYTFSFTPPQFPTISNTSRQTHLTAQQEISPKFAPKTIKNHIRFPSLKCLLHRNTKEKESMNWLEKISADGHLYNNLSSFLNQYEASDLEKALQLYRATHQTYICKTKQGKQSIIKINIYDIIYLEIQKHNISVHTKHGTYHKYGSLANELKLLSPYGFVKCTRNCIVSLNHIQSIHGDDIILINGNRIHMSRKCAASIIIAFSQSKPF